MVLVSAFLVLLRRYTGEEDLVIGCPTAGRSNVATEGMIGVFVNMLVLRADLSGSPPFRRLLQRVRQATLEMLEHRDVPFERLVERLNPAREPSRTPVFQVIFNLENLPSEPVPGTRFRVEHLDRGISAFDVELELRESGDELFCDLTYNRDLFEIEMIQGLAQAYLRLLESVVEDVDRPIDRLPLLSPEARYRLLVEWNESAADAPRGASMHEAFASQAKRRPDAPALISSRETLTYRELDERTNQLARHLIKLGVATGRYVVLCLPRSIDLVVAALATLKAGGAYVPLDPDEPGDRRASMLADVQPAVILTQARLESDRVAIAEESTGRLAVESLPEAPAYVIYTSGTTGNPKGVVVPHRAVLRLLIDARFVDLGEGQTHLLLAPFSFDAAAFELWGALLNGGCCVVAGGGHPTPKELEAVIEAHGVTTLWLTSSLFNVVIDENPRALSRLGQLLIGGEALSVSHVRRGMKLLPTLRIINGYGPTEATIFSTSYELQGLDEMARSVPIGWPVGHTKIYILDEHLDPVPLGVPGDLYISGEGLALGYLHAPELTAERFIADPFANDGDRMYRSGDLARHLPDGSIEFLGRRDRQVKIRGFRVELGEIEAALRTCDGVQDAVAAVREDHRGEKRLVAAVSGHADPGEVRRQLESKLPTHMVPHPIATVEVLPRTSSGKASTDALPDLVVDLSRETERPVIAPRNRTERDLAGIWRDVLELPTIDVRDDFFDLGGHSLLAARMFARIEHVFGKDIPVATLFNAPTIEQLAAVVDATDGSEDWSSLISISPEGTNPPFFCVAHGDVIGLERLAAHLPAHQPFYGLLQAHGLALVPPSPGSIEEMATEYIAEVRRVQPRGPYYLGGRCIGSVVAFEMAKQLVSEGDEVAVVVVQDTFVAPTLVGVGEAIFAGIAELRKAPQPSIYRRAVVGLRWLLPRPVGDLLRAMAAPFRGKPQVAPLAATPADLEQERRTERIRQANYGARDRYSTTPYSGRLALLQGANSEPLQRLQRVWQYATVGQFEVYPLSGDHDQMWQEPWVKDHARNLMACIEHAMSSVSG